MLRVALAVAALVSIIHNQLEPKMKEKKACTSLRDLQRCCILLDSKFWQTIINNQGNNLELQVALA